MRFSTPYLLFALFAPLSYTAPVTDNTGLSARIPHPEALTDVLFGDALGKR